MTQTYVETPPSVAAGLLQLARLKSGMSQATLGAKAGVPATMISAYERDLRQPTLPTLLRLLAAAGYELSMHLIPSDHHDGVLAALDETRTLAKHHWRDQQQEKWRQAVEVDSLSSPG